MSTPLNASPRLSASARLVMNGLMRRPRSLPGWFVREAASPELLDEVTHTRDAAVMPAERALLIAAVETIAAAVRPGATLVELDADGRDRWSALGEGLLARHGRLGYAPVSPSEARLTASVVGASGRSPGLEVMAVRADFVQSVRFLVSVPGPRLLLLTAGRLAPFSPPEAATLLRTLRAVMHPDDRLVIVGDARTGDAITGALADRDEAAGLERRLAMGAIERLVHELGADFDRRMWCHEVAWSDEAQRAEVRLVARARQPVFVDALGLPLLFARGESIHVESHQQLPEPVLDRLLFAGGFAPVARWRDDAASLVLARVQ